MLLNCSSVIKKPCLVIVSFTFFRFFFFQIVKLTEHVDLTVLTKSCKGILLITALHQCSALI